MSSEQPTKIAINRDDYQAKNIGITRDGRQFFLTTPFVPETEENPGNEFVALYLFDVSGKLIEAKIDEFGPRGSMDRERRSRLCKELLEELGRVTFKRIEIQPFAIERFGTTFGLIPQLSDFDESEWCVQAEPGNYMAFSPPWDSGEYDS